MKVYRHFQTPSSRALDEVFAWVVTEPDGSEGFAVAHVPIEGGVMALPLVGGDLARMESLRHWAVKTRRDTGWAVRLVRFSTRTTVEEL